MSFSTVLESIYDGSSQLPNNTNKTELPTSPKEFQKPSMDDGSQSDEYTPELDCDNDEECIDDTPENTLAHSLVQWIKDNADIIHDVLDAVESGEADDGAFGGYSELGPIGNNRPQAEFEERSTLQSTEQPDANSPESEFDSSDFGVDNETDPAAGDVDDLSGLASADDDKQGDIRSVSDAHLVYKRKTADGTFEELWFYNVGSDASRSDDEIKKDILSGTSIDPKKLSSEDGKQQYKIWTIGNGQMIHIVGVES